MKRHDWLGANRILGRLVRLPLRLIPTGAVVPVLSGELFRMRWIAGSSPHGCWIGTYERQAQRIARTVASRGNIVYDIGANVGFFTLLFSRVVGPEGKVVAFEPLGSNADLLERHLALNSCENVEVLRAAVSEGAGTARFSAGKGSCQGRLDTGGSLAVRTTSVDHELFGLSRAAPNVLKLDIEGAESRALIGAERTLSRFHPKLGIETHGWQEHLKCRELIREMDYSIELEIETGTSGHGSLVGVWKHSTSEGRGS